ncbi:lytic transglycosylase domain-containing protein [Luedemannella helvata]|uniref:Transglycosylase SLT domain-containing protein n=1 Tax=Luedemannella helvata TaxID=349315 RepID=A0ABP4WY42_9ACTN
MPATRPPKKDLPPPPNNKSGPTSGPDCPRKTGTDASRSAVRNALVAAGARDYWPDAAYPPSGYDGELPTITVPASLMKAIAWQESGWQSTILACDGGIGTMQVMPGTASWLNERFGPNYDVNTLAGNVALGAEYLEWEIVYFGAFYFGSFDLDATAPVSADGKEMVLRDVVLAAYNVGPGEVEIDGDGDGQGDYLRVPNQRYVDNVTALITECVCLSY